MTEWQTKTVGEVADTQLGKMLNKGKQSGKYAKPYLRTDNVHWGRFDLSQIKEMDILPAEQEKYLATKGDLLMCEGGASGRTAIWNEDYDISFQNHVHRIRPKDPKEISPKYLLYYFEWFIKNGYASDLIKGVTISSLSQSGLRSIEVTYPPIDEQHKIVELLEDHLSRLDAALDDVKQAKLRASQFRRSLLQAAFTGDLGSEGVGFKTKLPNGWSYESINSIVEGGMIADGDWVESKDQDPSGEVRLTQLADVGDGEFRSRSDRWMNDEQASRLNVKYLQAGDLLMARMPDPLGRTCMVPENIGRAVTVVDVAIIRISRKGVNPKFVMWLLNSPVIRQQIEMLASGTTRRRITRKNLGTIDLPMPPIDEQHKIVELLEDYLSRLDVSVSLADSMEKQSSGLRRTILQAAFTGQLTKEVVSV